MIGPNANRLAAWVVCHCLLMVLVIMGFAPWWWSGKVLAPLDALSGLMVPWRDTGIAPVVHNHFVTDALTQYLPYRWLAQESYRADGFVGWNNMNGGGMNQYANTMALYFDWTMQLHRWLDFWPAWHLGLMGQLLLAGSGLLVFLRSRGINPWLALAGAVAFLLNFQFVAWIYHRWALAAFCWVPWLLWAGMRRREGSRRHGLLVPVLLALAFVGGTLQHAMFIVILMGCLWLAWCVQDRREPRQLLATTAGLLTLSATGVALASPVLVPCVRAYLENVQAGNVRGELGYAGGWLQAPLNLVSYIAYIFPHPLGAPATMDGWKLLKSNLFNVAYCGAIPFIVAAGAATSRRFPLEARVLTVVGFLLPLTPLVGPLYHRVALVGIMGAVWLFAHALEHEREWLKQISRRAAPVLGVLVLLWLGLSALIHWRQGPLQQDLDSRILGQAAGSAFGCLSAWLQNRGHGWLDGLLVWRWHNLIPLAAVALGFILLRRPGTVCRLGLGLAGLLAIEMSVYAGRWITFARPPSVGIFPVTEETQAVRAFVGAGMVYSPPAGICREPFFPNTLSVYGVRAWHYYESIQPRGMAEPWGAKPSAEQLALCGVTHLLTTADQPAPTVGWNAVWRNSRVALYENAHQWPRYCALPANASWNVEQPLRLPDTVTVLAETQNRRTLRVPAGAGSVRIAENWSANWEYSLDGQAWRPAQRASDASLVLPLTVATTEQLVRMRYRPRWFPARLGAP